MNCAAFSMHYDADRAGKSTKLRITIFSALNTIFSEWGNILFNTTIAAAIADRLVENSEAFVMGGLTWRNPKSGQASPKE